MPPRRPMKGASHKKLTFKESMRDLKRIFGLMFRQYPVLVIVVILTILLSSFGSVLGNVFTGQVVVNYYINSALGKETSLPWMFKFLEGTQLSTGIIVMAGIYLFSLVCAYFYQFLCSVVGQGVQKKIRDQVFEHMETLPLSYFDSRTHGDVMSIYTNDIDTLRELLSRVLPMAVQSIVVMISAFVAMLTSSYVLLLVVICFLVFILLCTFFVGGNSAKYFVGAQRALGKTDGYIEEMISGQKVVKVFNHEDTCKEEFDKLNDELCELTIKANKFSMIVGPVVNNLTNLQFVVLAFVGGIGVALNWPTLAAPAGVGIIVSFLSLGRRFTQPVMQLASNINMINMALAGSERIFALLDEPSEVDNGYVTLVNAKSRSDGMPIECDEPTGQWAWKHPHNDGSLTYQWLEGRIDMIDVDFSYVKGKQILNGVSLYAKPGQKVAFVGPTGAGKTTITNLLNRFYDIEDGKIRFDGININKIKKKDLRKAIGMVLQETNLFTGTVKDNIAYGKSDATMEEVVNAAKLANADNFIRMLPNGYDTVLTGAGSGLSQGQRQLISIARAACVNPPVLILDEATSSIDSRTEKLVQQGMDAIMKGRTVFVIAHRLSTIQNSDVIIVLEQGKIIEKGDHEDLIAQKGKYYQLYTGGLVVDN